jgi:ABC-type uncharacterized transport system substrate-binding protein
MKSKLLFWLLITVLLITGSAHAQQTGKVAKIGWLGTRPTSAGGQETITRILRGLGYVEGKNIAFEYRFADNKIDRLPSLADELVRLKVDVVVTPGISEALVAKNATKTIRIVFFSAVDPVAAGLVDSLPRPGGNITGLSNILPELAGKRLVLLKDVVPKLSRVAFLAARAAGTADNLFVKEAQDAGPNLGIQIQSLMVQGPEEFDAAFASMVREKAGALVVQPLFIGGLGYGPRIAGLAARSRLPTVSDQAQFANEGGLMFYGPDILEPTRRAATYVDKILKGAKPADLPGEQPTKFELIINLKAAKQIGLTIPPKVLARADKVIR